MKGSIKIVLPQEAKGLTLGYAKIAETAGEGEDLLRENMEYTQRITVGNKNTVELTDLEEGVYQMQIFAEEEYEFMPSVVSIPMWDENKEEMQYEFTVIPKYIYHEPEEEILQKIYEEQLIQKVMQIIVSFGNEWVSIIQMKLFQEKTFAEIAKELKVSENTVKMHTTSLFRILKVSSREEIFNMVNSDDGKN